MSRPRFQILLMWLCLSAYVALQAKPSSIRKVAPLVVETAVGTVPSLPFQVWVTYSDGRGEWRQVRWDNSRRSVEERQADAMLHPVGSSYKVTGNILGDNTTDDGYPVSARIRVADSMPVPPCPVAHPLPLNDVKLTGVNRLTSNRDLDVRAILSWDVAQQLYNYRDTYGLPTDGYPVSDGWDSPTTKLKGHGTGHYLSALALAFASVREDSIRDELRRRIRRMVDELRACQERTFVWNDSLGRYWEARDLAPEPALRRMKGNWTAFDEYKRDWSHYGYGYLNAIPPQHALLVEAYRPYNNEEWVWAPYYTIHKQLAGLIDVALHVDDEQVAQKALLIAKDMGLWVWNRLHYRTFVQTEGSQAERRHRPGNRYEMWNMYIAGEVGGMAESLSRLAEMVSDSLESARLLEAASYFDAPAFFNPLSRNIDEIRTRHANQHIPMIVGALRSYRLNHNPYYYRLAHNFWNLVQGRYSYAMGGVGNGEMFRQPYGQVLGEHVNETCCAYNLAKLTKELNCYTPDDAQLMDYYERLLYNQIVGSLHPAHYAVTYQYAVGMNAAKPFGNETPQSTCCGGTGAENHVKYQESTYFVSDSVLWVALYLPTEAKWRAQGATIRQTCQWPAERSVIRVEGGGEFAMRLRVPYWATEGFDIRLNGRSVVKKRPMPSSYVEIPSRRWMLTDSVEVVMPYQPHVHFHPDQMDFAPQWVGALMLGPLVMATPDVHSWDEAQFHLSADRREVKVERDGQIPVVNCKLGQVTFQPDYWQTASSTHYLRWDVGSVRHRSRKTEKARWMQLREIALERMEIPWNWAPHGYARMVEALDAGNVNALKQAINTMRPANLAEPEDLTELQAILRIADRVTYKPEALVEAMEYGRMVIRYVQDGSGTSDMISRAVRSIRLALPAT